MNKQLLELLDIAEQAHNVADTELFEVTLKTARMLINENGWRELDDGLVADKDILLLWSDGEISVSNFNDVQLADAVNGDFSIQQCTPLKWMPLPEVDNE